MNFDLLLERAELPRRRTLRKSTLRSHPLDDLGMVMLLRKWVESGRGFLAGGVSGAGGMEELWCALVCLQHAR